jgi:hypothetical protein
MAFAGLSSQSILSIMISMFASETVQFQATPELRRQLEDEAAKLKLTLSAYILYLHSRMGQGQNLARFDRQIQEVFGKHGDLMRRLAK